jgi:hypothetical protein
MTRFICSAIKRRAPVVAYLQRHIPSLEVCWDDSGRCIGGYRQALELAGTDPFVFLEDDILITKDFIPKIERVIAERPGQVIQFHSRAKKDQTIGSRYRTGREFYNHQCVYFPQDFGRYILHYSDHPQYQDFDNPHCYSDVLTQDFLHEFGLKYWVSIPSLVDHLPDISAVNPKRSKSGVKRQARVFLDPETEGCPADLLSQWRPLT